MFLLDTDHITFLQQQTLPQYARIVQRMSQHPAQDIFFSIISYHEQMLGAQAYINRARAVADIVAGYELLDQIRTFYATVQVAPFDTAAAQRFEQLRQQKVRIGTMDLRIAAIALERGWTVLTRNRADFHQVPGLLLSDGTL